MRPRARHLATAAVVLLALVGVGLALTGSVFVSGTIPLDATDGPQIDLVTSSESELVLDGPDSPNTVNITHAEGNITFESNDPTDAEILDTEIEGTTTTVSSIDASGAELRIDPADKQLVGVEGGISELSFRDVVLDDGTVDVTYTAGSQGTLRLMELPANQTVILVDAETETVVDDTMTDGNGEGTFTLDSATDRDLFVQTTQRPQINDSSADPADGEFVSESPVQLSLNVSDGDFNTSGGDEVNVTFYDASDDSVIGSDTLTSDGTATTMWSDPMLGTNEWYAVANDSFGNSDTSETFSFDTPHEIVIRNESDPDEIVDNATVTVTFFEQDGNGETIIERETTDGRINMEGLPDEEFVIQVDADGYVTRQAIIDSVIDQQDIYILPDNENTALVRFVLDDETGQFEQDSSQLFVQRPITRNGTTTYETVAADNFGPGGYSVTLETDVRYRLRVRNAEGDVRTIEPYTATVDETVTLEVDRTEFELNDLEGLQWGFTVEGGEEEPATASFTYRDPEELTTSVDVLVYERGNESNVLIDDTFASGPYGNLTVTEQATGNTTEWAIEWSAERDGETVTGERYAGQQLFIDADVPPWLQHAIAIFTILIVGGLASQVNAPAVAVATVFVGSGYWFIGWLPDVVGGGVLVFALAIAGFYIVSGATQPGGRI